MPLDDTPYTASILFRTISLLCQTLCYGIYISLIPLSTYVIIKKGFASRVRVLLFSMIIFMFTLSTGFWAVSVFHLVQVIRGTSDAIKIDYLSLCNAIVLVNYILTDAVVVWRAWVICKEDFRLVLGIPIGILCLTTLSISTTIGIRVTITIQNAQSLDVARLSRALDYAQVTNLGLSLLTNILATSIIGVKAWRHRWWIREELQMAHKHTRAEKALTLLIESGLLYCLSGAMVLVATLIRLPSGFGTLGDIYTPVNVQIAGIYPAIVLLVVTQQQTIHETTLFSVPEMTRTTEERVPSRLGSLHFARRASSQTPVSRSSSIFSHF